MPVPLTGSTGDPETTIEQLSHQSHPQKHLQHVIKKCDKLQLATAFHQVWQYSGAALRPNGSIHDGFLTERQGQATSPAVSIAAEY